MPKQRMLCRCTVEPTTHILVSARNPAPVNCKVKPAHTTTLQSHTTPVYRQVCKCMYASMYVCRHVCTMYVYMYVLCIYVLMYVWYVAHFKQNAGRATTRRAVVRGRVKQLGTHTAAVCQTAVSLQWPPSAGRAAMSVPSKRQETETSAPPPPRTQTPPPDRCTHTLQSHPKTAAPQHRSW